MALFGGKAKSAKKKAPAAKKTSKSNSDAKAVLARMQAKKDAGDCPFC